MAGNTMIEQLLFEAWWPGTLAWVLLYVSDYYLTIRSATIYRARVKDVLVFEGSFELTPYFQKDIDGLKRLSPRFLLALTWTTALLLGYWWLSTHYSSWSLGYEAMLGCFLLLELAVHLRHFRNLHLFSFAFRGGGIRGRVEYPRHVILRVSAFELAQVAALFAVLAIVASSWFLAGGAASCAIAALKHKRLASRARLAADPRGDQAGAGQQTSSLNP